MQKKIGIVSLGCAKNQVDTENFISELKKAGHEIVSDPARAEIIFINTCGFIEPAKRESIETIFETARYKELGRLEKLFVTGCLVQRYIDDLYDEMPEVDGFLGVREYTRVNELIEQAYEGRRCRYTGMGERFPRMGRALISKPYAPYVKISDGCDNRCAYCAIPLIRGGYESRPARDIISECRMLAEGGAREITLIAQDTSRYGCDFEKKPEHTLAGLIRSVSGIDGVEWVRSLYCYPDSVSLELLDEIAGNPRAVKYLDLPLQHINAELLKRMNRRGSPELIERLLDECRSRGIIVRTTMIVGFPGETEGQFNELLEFVKRRRFDRLGAFAFSPEEGTAAYSMPDQVPEEVKERRLDALMTLQQGISLEKNEARLGEICKVLVEGSRGEFYVGRSWAEAPESDGIIYFKSEKPLAEGGFTDVKITSNDAYDLYGEVVVQ